MRARVIRGVAVAAVLSGAALGAGCTNSNRSAPKPPVMQGGVARYGEDRANGTVACEAGTPVVVAANRTKLRLAGPCRQVTVAGDHNDLHVDVAPGGTVEITGTHNDVTWRQVGQGPRPTLTIKGASNDFHQVSTGG